MNGDVERILRCLCCHLPNPVEFLNLGEQPLANNFQPKCKPGNVYPLQLNYCSHCFHCQLSHAVNPEILFKTYRYVSGTSFTGLEFFRGNAALIAKEKEHEYISFEHKNLTATVPQFNVLDIACNDGSQLDFFKDLGWVTYGVDPAINLFSVASSKGHTIICDFWTEAVAQSLPTMHVITAQNVFAHTLYVDEFLRNCKIVMDNRTSLFIQTSQKNMIVNTEFDTTYHEHISFFNTKSMKILVERNGLFLNRVMEADIHGKSYIFEINTVKSYGESNVDVYLRNEDALGLYNTQIYEDFSKKTSDIVFAMKALLAEYSSGGYKCIGYGAAAKGQTYLSYGNIKLDYIIDENPLKIGLFSSQNIPIVDIAHFVNDVYDKILIIILAWNFAKEIVEKIQNNLGTKRVVVIESYFQLRTFRL